MDFVFIAVEPATLCLTANLRSVGPKETEKAGQAVIDQCLETQKNATPNVVLVASRISMFRSARFGAMVLQFKYLAYLRTSRAELEAQP